MTEETYLQSYNAEKYKRPSVAADIVVFTLDEENILNILLIQRGNYPYKEKWALPGGFLNVDNESIYETAARELKEETGVDNAFIKQLYTFGSPKRDPRMHVISVSYTALIPKCKLSYKAGDDAANAQLFKIDFNEEKLRFKNDDFILHEDDLAFDHATIIHTAIDRIRGRISYEPDAFYLLEDRTKFTIYELKKIYEAIQNKTLDTPNFRKWFTRNFVDSGIVKSIGEITPKYKNKLTKVYKFMEG